MRDMDEKSLSTIRASMEPKYDVPTGEEEAARLIDQHEMVKGMLGCILHPSIPLAQPGLRVADMATGTATWPLEVAALLPPDSQIHGFDMSTAHFPRAVALPPNVFLHEQNVLEPYPARFRGFFDVIQVRLITLGLRGDDWDRAVENIVTLLQPGGYLQWIDPDHTRARLLNLEPGAPATAAREVVALMADVCRQIMYPGPLRLPEIYAKNGMETLAVDIFSCTIDPRYRQSHTVMFVNTGGPLMLQRLVREKKLAAERADELVKRALEEIATGGLYVHSEVHLVVGKKLAR